jgi:hypothetical protein
MRRSFVEATRRLRSSCWEWPQGSSELRNLESHPGEGGLDGLAQPAGGDPNRDQPSARGLVARSRNLKVGHEFCFSVVEVLTR